MENILCFIILFPSCHQLLSQSQLCFYTHTQTHPSLHTHTHIRTHIVFSYFQLYLQLQRTSSVSLTEMPSQAPLTLIHMQFLPHTKILVLLRLSDYCACSCNSQFIITHPAIYLCTIYTNCKPLKVFCVDAVPLIVLDLKKP